MKTPTPITTTLGLITAALLAGCAGGEIYEGRPYPEDLRRTPVANIQVLRKNNVIRFTNTTVRTFEDATIWANEWYRRDVGDINPGEPVQLYLTDFRDEYGGRFSGGGFFAARDPDRLVLAEIEHGPDPDRVMTPIIVIDGTAE